MPNGRWDPGETYTDTNGNGRYDHGDPPHTDLNGNGVWDASVDILFDADGDGQVGGAAAWLQDPAQWATLDRSGFTDVVFDANRNYNWDGGYIISDPSQWVNPPWAEHYTDINNNDRYDLGETWVDVANGQWDSGETFTDIGNGVRDAAEPYTDLNSNSHYDPPTGCPLPRAPDDTPTSTPCSHDPSLIAAVYPPGHARAGEATGYCFPTGHPCLPPPDGTGAADVVCHPRGS